MTYLEFKERWFSDDNSFEIRTSGSTGKPKVITFSKGEALRSAERTLRFFFGDNFATVCKGMRFHSCLSPDTIGGRMMAVRSWSVGANFSFESPSNKPLSNMSADDRIDFLAVVPSQLRYILDNEPMMPTIRYILVGGAPLSVELRLQSARSSFRVFESYGMTETLSHIALRSPDEDYFTCLRPIFLSSGVNDTLKIHLEERIIETTDVAELLSPTQFRIIGRVDNVIITGAKKLHPEVVESKIAPVIQGYFGVPEGSFCISSIADPFWGERSVLVVEAPENKSPEDSEQVIQGVYEEETIYELPKYLKDLLSECLEKWECPKDFLLIKKIPRVGNGKTDRISIREFLKSASL